MRDVPVRDAASSALTTPIPLTPGRQDSVPPLSSTHVTSRPRANVLRRAARRGILIALPSIIAIVGRATTSLEHKPTMARTSLNGFVEAHPFSIPVDVHQKSDLEDQDDDTEPTTLEAQRARLLDRMRTQLELSDEQAKSVTSIFEASPYMGQGNPTLSRHPMSRFECREVRKQASITRASSSACSAPGMVPIYDPSSGQTDADARTCIDELEFPNVPCEYPVVHVRANEAAGLCRAIGKRICDTHEWEGACAGALRSADVEYQWGRPRAEVATYHNHTRDVVWSYGPQKNHAICGLHSSRSPECPGGGYEKCGSNTYPTGAFPECRSPFGVFDMHGNVAEHMSLPTIPGELARNGDLGFTEMKGSWFAFGEQYPHNDDCRWRAPAWHETRLSSESSHYNYHLGFRCCKDI